MSSTQIVQQPKPISIVGYPGNPISFVLRFSEAVPDGLAVAAAHQYNDETAITPTLTPLVGTHDVSVTFSQAQTTTINSAPYWVVISWGGIKQIAGPITTRKASAPATALIHEIDLTASLSVTVLINAELAQALIYKNAASVSEANALAYRNAAAISAELAAESQNTAYGSEDNAYGSELNALAYKNAAGTSATNAANSEANALASKNAAGTSEANALASKNAAGTSEANALASKNAAGTSATNAANSEANALAYKNAAAASALLAAQQAQNLTYLDNNVTTTYTIDCSLRDNISCYLTLIGNVNIVIINMAIGKNIYLRTVQGGAGNWSITFPASVRFPGGAAIDQNLTAGSVTTFNINASSATAADGWYSKQ